MKRSGLSTGVLVGAVVIVVVIAAATFLFLGGIGGGAPGNTTSTTTISTASSIPSSSTISTQATPPQGLQAAFQSHLQKIGVKDISGLLNDYQQNAVVIWAGNAQGLEGTYSGRANIQLLYAAAIGTAKQVAFNGSGYKEYINSSAEETVTSNLTFGGTSDALGVFNGTALGRTDYVYVNGAWQIKQETWTFKVFAGTNVTEATTFPQWQRAGPTNPSRRSPDWLHNFAWDYGGPGAALLVYVYIASVAVSLVVIRLRRR